MGILSSIIKLFKNDEPLKESIRQSELESWVSNKKEIELKKSQALSMPLIQKILNENESLFKNISTFETKELTNTKVEPRLIEIAKSNKEIFIILFKRFIDDIRRLNSSTPKGFFESAITLSEGLSKSTRKVTLILENFYSHDIDKISHNITSINNLAKKGKSNYESSTLKSLDEIELEINEFKTKDQLFKNISEELSKKEDQLKDLAKNLTLIEAKINAIKNKIEYKRLKKEEENLSKITKSKEKKELEFIEKFSALEKALKKYSHISLEEKFIEQMLKEPLKTFLNPDDSIPIKIIHILRDLKKALEKNTLSLDQKKLEKTKAELCDYSLDYINNLRRDFFELEKEEQSMVAKIQKNQISQSLKDLEDEMQSLRLSLPKLESEVESLKSKIPISPDIHLNLIIQKAKDIGIELTIT